MVDVDPAADWLDELPLVPGPPDLRMGTHNLDIRKWFPVDSHTETELQLRRQLLAEHDGLVRLLPGHDEAVAELMSLAGIHLGRAFAPTSRPALEQLAISVPDDVLLMWRDDEHWRLVGGAVLFPNQWTLEEKLGRTIADIHGPVEGYHEMLERRVDQFFDRLTAPRPVWRRNWFVHDDPAFFRPDRSSHRRIVDPEDVASLCVRSEWQTLRRLAFSGTIVFTIKTQNAPMTQLRARPLAASQMVAYLEQASPRALKNTDTLGRQEAIIEFLRPVRHSAQSGGRFSR